MADDWDRSCLRGGEKGCIIKPMSRNEAGIPRKANGVKYRLYGLSRGTVTSRLLFCGVLLPLWGATPAHAQSEHAELRDMLSSATLRVDVLQPWVPPVLTELTAKVQAAAEADPAWFRAHATAAKPGAPLPYDVKLGLTEAEYVTFLRLVDSTEMRAGAQASLAIVSIPAGWRFDEGTSLPELRGIEIDTVLGVVRSSFGELRAGPPIQPSAGQRATGPWRALRWQREALNASATEGTTATFAIGRFTASGLLIVYLQGREVANGALTRRVDVVLRGRP